MVPDNIILCPIDFASKSLTGAEHTYSNIEQEALGILHSLEKFHHYCFGREVLIITDHKLQVSMFKKKRYSHIFTAYTMHTAQNSSVLGTDYI